VNDATMRNLNLAFRFVLELLVLLALFLFGMGASDDLLIALPVAIVLVAIVMAIWGLFVSPRASHRLSDPSRLGLELAIFFIGVLAFGLAVGWVVAVLFGLAVLTSLALMFMLGQRGR
jgi:hypothetical protein